MAQETASLTVDPREIDNFSAMAAEWWDPEGSFRPLHQLNPVRLGWIRDVLCARFDRDPQQIRALDGLSILDVGCGGGLISEPVSRMGAAVTGIDAGETNIGIAAAHAAETGAHVDYRCATAEALAAEGGTFDAVLALEIVEHVADLPVFLKSLCALTRPGGTLVLSTLNRTPKSYLFAIVGAEYVMRWLPRGTHQWQKFVKPSELQRGLRQNGALVEEMTGLIYNPVSGDWRLARDFAVNYMVAAAMPDGS